MVSQSTSVAVFFLIVGILISSGGWGGSSDAGWSSSAKGSFGGSSGSGWGANLPKPSSSNKNADQKMQITGWITVPQ
ncbi:unnamed protein product [Anisakis simplex]|uniref:Salivary secreted peptide n=1 Tax=Anisakis simplex TaxID=6269 RepID=A0A0M3K4X3_ANISI|nr:unnamed protein product [Anisakis simplex]